MAKKNHKSKQHRVAKDPDQVLPTSLGEARSAVEAALAAGKQKTAVDIAKAFHAATNTEASRALLLDAYFARVSGMYAKNMPDEARSLMEVVLSKFPESRPRFEALLRRATAGTSSLDALLAPLLNPSLSEADRAEIESLLRHETTDLAAVANCRVLPESHPLRMQATQLYGALEAVCTRVVQEDELALDLVSRRSPLAPWKLLIRAIAAYYRHDDTACLHFADAIPKDSAPARLVPVLHAMVHRSGTDAFTIAQRALITAVVDYPRDLASALEKLDAMLADESINSSSIFKRIPATVRALAGESCSVRDEVLFRIEALLVSLMAPYNLILAVCPKPARKDARFWQFAAALSAITDHLLEVILWNEYRLHAIREGRFQAGGLEESVLFHRMAQAVSNCLKPPILFSFRWKEHVLEEAQDILDALSEIAHRGLPAGRAAVVTDEERAEILTWLEDPILLYRRAAEGAADPMFFTEWYELCQRKGRNGHRLEEPLHAWRKALPHDPSPLLILGRNALNRGAHRKALAFLDEALALDPLNPECRSLQLEALIPAALSHIRARKLTLLTRAISEIQTRSNSGPKLQSAITALSWAKGTLEKDQAASDTAVRDLSAQLKSEAAASLLLDGLARTTKLDRPSGPLGVPGDDVLIESTARFINAALRLDIAVTLPSKWSKSLIKRLVEVTPQPIRAWQYTDIARGASESGNIPLTYAACGAGLALGGATEASFMLIRGSVLSRGHDRVRAQLCLVAAARLAQRQGDRDVAGLAIETLTHLSHSIFDDESGIRAKLDISDAVIDQVRNIEVELRDPKYLTSDHRKYTQEMRRAVEFPHAYDGAVDPEWDDAMPEVSWDSDDPFPRVPKPKKKKSKKKKTNTTASGTSAQRSKRVVPLETMELFPEEAPKD